MFRQIGGSIGVALFGTIFANRLHVELAARLPQGTHIPKAINPAGIQHLPPAAHSAFADAVAAALHPVFLVAGVVSVLAFALTWLLREVPLEDADELGAPTTEPARGRARRRLATTDRAVRGRSRQRLSEGGRQQRP